MSFLRCLQAPWSWTKPPQAFASLRSPRPPQSALKTSSSFFLHLLPLIWHSPRAPVQTGPSHMPLAVRPFPRPHADSRHTNTATVKGGADKTQSKVLMDGRSGSGGQGRTHSSLFLCSVSRHRLLGRALLFPWPCGNPHRAPHSRTLVKVFPSFVAEVYLNSPSAFSPSPSLPPPLPPLRSDVIWYSERMWPTDPIMHYPTSPSPPFHFQVYISISLPSLLLSLHEKQSLFSASLNSGSITLLNSCICPKAGLDAIKQKNS